MHPPAEKVCCNYNTQRGFCGRFGTVSFKCRQTARAIRKTGIRESLSVTGREREAFLARLKENRREAEFPYDMLLEHAEAGEIRIGPCRTLILTPKENATGRGVLYLAGGEFMNPPGESDYRLALKITEKTGCDVVMPLYPLFPEHNLDEMLKAMLKVIQFMDSRYPAESSAVLGFSSGASLCLYLFLCIKEAELSVTMPGRWILNSPLLRLPPEAYELRYMWILEPYDVVLPVHFMEPAGLSGSMIDAASPEIRSLANIPANNLKGMPEIDLFIGTQEIGFACMEAFVQRCEMDNVNLHVHEGLGMMHCWGLYPEMKEGRKTQDEYFRILKELKPIE